MLGVILARHGVRVLLIDSASHPRFAIGESTTPHFSLMLEFMAERFAVPELMSLASMSRIRQNITSSCGVKRAAGFTYHHEGKEQDPREIHQIGISEHLRASEKHLFRQDIDTYLLYAAIRNGAVVRQQTQITELTIDEQGVRLEAEGGDKFNARYLVDASGYRSLLADKFKLRETPTRLKTRSRAIFTHMIDVKPYDECLRPLEDYKMSDSWFETTLSHLFDGGWIWIIPFNNVPGATNPLCSVGLNLDLRRFPESDLSPEQEFWQFVSRFPTIARQLENAKPVRNWVGTRRLQYSSKASLGYRFCLMAHAAGFADAQFAGGLTITVDIINALVNPLLKALADDDFALERFENVERLQQELLDNHDQACNCFYVSLSDFDLWNAWLRVFVAGAVSVEGSVFQVLDKYRRTGDSSLLVEFDGPEHRYKLLDNSGYKTFLGAVISEIEAVEEGRIAPAEAASRILTLLDKADLTLSGIGKFEQSFLWLIKNPSIRDLSVNLNTYRYWQRQTAAQPRL